MAGDWKPIDFLARERNARRKKCSLIVIFRARGGEGRPSAPVKRNVEITFPGFKLLPTRPRFGILRARDSIAYGTLAHTYIYTYEIHLIIGVPRSLGPCPCSSLTPARGARFSRERNRFSAYVDTSYVRVVRHYTYVNVYRTPLCRFALGTGVRTRNSLRLLFRSSCCCKEADTVN